MRRDTKGLALPSHQQSLANIPTTAYLDRLLEREHPVSSLENVKLERPKALAVTISNRLDNFPEVPTMIKSGLTGYEAATWYGFVVRSATPPAIVDQINQASNQAIEDPAVHERMDAIGIKLLGGSSAQFADSIRVDMDKWGGVLRKAGIRAETRR